MKPNHLFTSILAVAAIAVSACSTPKLAQQGVDSDDVYNSTAQAKTYVPAPIMPSQQVPDRQYEEDDYYGTSDPYYDMDYSSRINRFSYGSAWRSYYDPYFYGSLYSPYSVYLGYNNFYGGGFYGPGWGYLSSPFWGYNNFGYNNWGYSNYYGGGYYGGGFLGGGYYGGGGYYTGRTTMVPDYKARPYLGRENGVGITTRGMARPSSSVTRRSDASGNIVNERSRSDRYVPNTSTTAPTRSERSTASPARPERTQSAPPPRPAPASTPPTRSESTRGSSGSSSSGSSSGSGARPTRAGRG